jgi:formylglycine-generating enzyme
VSDPGGCCAPSRGGEGATRAVEASERGLTTSGMVEIPGGTFWMGSDDSFAYSQDGEAPAREVELGPFWIDACAVSNGQFEEFVNESGYVTEAERFGWSFVFAGLLPDDFPPTEAVAQAPWWRRVDGADWSHPEGPQSSLEGRADNPVVHVSWNDAAAYCAWAAKRLPTEAEWERAARGDLERKVFPWGDELEPAGEHRMNVWQGTFPAVNTLDDGFLGLAPWTHSSRTASGSTTPRGTSGSGRRTGSIRPFGRATASATRSVRRTARKGAKGRFLPLLPLVLPSLPSRSAAGKHSGLLDRQRRLPLRPRRKLKPRPRLRLASKRRQCRAARHGRRYCF